MPLLGKQWLIIDGGSWDGEPGGVISEDFGPSERLNENEMKAALIAAGAVRDGSGVLIGANGEGREFSACYLDTFKALAEAHDSNLGAMTPIEEFITSILMIYGLGRLDVKSILDEVEHLQSEMEFVERDMKVLAAKYRKQLEAAIDAVGASEESEAGTEDVESAAQAAAKTRRKNAASQRSHRTASTEEACA